MYTVIKILSSAIVIGLVTELARRFPTYGGIIAALPLISLLSLIWLTVQGQTNEQIQQFTLGVIIGLPATIILLISVYIALKNNVHLGFAIIIGTICWASFLGIQHLIQQVIQS